jgi:hypothetical protein
MLMEPKSPRPRTLLVASLATAVLTLFGCESGQVEREWLFGFQG